MPVPIYIPHSAQEEKPISKDAQDFFSKIKKTDSIEGDTSLLEHIHEAKTLD